MLEFIVSIIDVTFSVFGLITGTINLILTAIMTALSCGGMLIVVGIIVLIILI